MLRIKLGQILMGFMKSALFIVWVWFILMTMEKVFTYMNPGELLFPVNAIIIAATPVLVIWFGIFVFTVFKIIKVEF